MKRRLSLAITLLAEPELIILDEPTVGIDPKLRQQMATIQANDQRRKRVSSSQHVMDEAERCDKLDLLSTEEYLL